MNWIKLLWCKYMKGARANYFPLLRRTSKVPGNLMEAILAIDALLSDDDKERFDEWTEAQFTARTHHSLGRLIRNEWELWVDGTPLVKWFMARNISHADDMSGIILTSYYRHAHSQPLNLDEQVKFYLDYWDAENSSELI